MRRIVILNRKTLDKETYVITLGYKSLLREDVLIWFYVSIYIL